VGARNALALCLQKLDRPAEAVAQVDVLLSQHPNLGYAHANKGNALMALGALGRAKLSHERALELEPGNLAAIAGLATIATHRGEHTEARRFAEQALARVPGLPDPVLCLAAAELAVGATDEALTLLWQLIGDPRAAPVDKARASGLLGDVLDARGLYREAFDAYTACNDAMREIHRRYASGTSVLAYAQALSSAMRRTTAEQWRACPAAVRSDRDPQAHVFLIGFPRSGTTLLEVVLDGHPEIASIEEHELLTEGVLRYMCEPLDFGALIGADEAELDRLRAAYWARVGSAGVDVTGKVFIDKHPLNTLKLPLIARLFPNAKILFACRDPRDVVLSCFRRRFKMNPAMYELLTLRGAAAFYDVVMGFGEQVRPLLGLDWHVVRYESLVEDLALETSRVCEFVGLSSVAGMGDFAERVQGREHSTPSTAQLARGLDRGGIGHWRHYAEALQPVQLTLRHWVDSLGYPP
jgi:tetratricopeptide (TPR) repeat protein